MSEAGLEVVPGEPLILRRTLNANGQSRAFINDAAASVQLLKAIGETLVEFHGQGDDRGLLDPRGHLRLLDAFGGLNGLASSVALAHVAWRDARNAAVAFEERRQRAAAEEDYLAHAAEELSKLAPEAGEEGALAEERALRLNAGRIAEDVSEALDVIAGTSGLEARLGQALRRLERVGDEARAVITPAAAALERTAIEAGEARSSLEAALEALRHDPERLAAVEERLFALRAAARKFRVSADELAIKRAEIDAQLAAIRSGDKETKNLAAAVEAARAQFVKLAGELSKKRQVAAAKLDGAVNNELAPLKLAKAEFATLIEDEPEARAGASGLDRVEFRIRTNAGQAPGPLQDIASGGELARFVLALKVVLAREGSAGTMIFDEVDRGIGGAVADAVGERLKRLAAGSQVLVVTHSPQVAARGDHHFLITKREAKGKTNAAVTVLGAEARREEIARMLSGSTVTAEARAAADRLLAGAEIAVEAARPRRKKASA
jgi:DNA repair protein RecN (Recombination protein N)